MSVSVWGDAAWHSQPKKEQGAPATFTPYKPPYNRWTKRRWDVDHQLHVREGLGPAHVNARLVMEAYGKPAIKPAWQS